MNSKLLFAATVAISALSLASTVAMAAGDTGPVTRAEVKAQTVGVSAGISRGEIYGEPSTSVTRAPSTLHRSEVVAELRAERAEHPYDNIGERYADPSLESTGRSTLARAEVKADVRHAVADGSLQRNGENDNASGVNSAGLTRAARQHMAFASK